MFARFLLSPASFPQEKLGEKLNARKDFYWVKLRQEAGNHHHLNSGGFNGTEIREQISDIIFNKQWHTSVRVLSDSSSIKYLVPLLSLSLCLSVSAQDWVVEISSRWMLKSNVNTIQTRDTQVINHNWLLGVVYVNTDSVIQPDISLIITLTFPPSNTWYWHKDTISDLDI